MKTLINLSFTLATSLAFIVAIAGPAQAHQCDPPTVTLVASGLGALFGNAHGPDGALYVTEATTGTIFRLDPQTDQVSTYATGLPNCPTCFGATDVEFIGDTAYALVTLVDPFVGGDSIDGIYRMDGPGLFTSIANIGRWAKHHPPQTPYDLPTGVQFGLKAYTDGFVVTDGHHNRVYRVSLDGKIRELIAFDNIVPTGLDVAGGSIYMTELGPVPCLPEDGKIIRFSASSHDPVELASGAPMVLDLAFDCSSHLYGLSQGVFPEGGLPGDPALPNTGSIVKANRDGTFTTVVSELNQPTSFAIVQDTAYVFTLNGEIWKVENVVCPARE